MNRDGTATRDAERLLLAVTDSWKRNESERSEVYLSSYIAPGNDISSYVYAAQLQALESIYETASNHFTPPL